MKLVDQAYNYVRDAAANGATVLFVGTKKQAQDAIAEEALKRNAGARGLRSIIESIMRNVMYDVPSRDDVKKCIVTEDTVRKHCDPQMIVE